MASLQLVQEPENPFEAAFAKLPPRDRARVVIAGYRAARATLDRELQASRDAAERVIVEIETWIAGGPAPRCAERDVDIDYVGAFNLDDAPLTLACAIADGDIEPQRLGIFDGCEGFVATVEDAMGSAACEAMWEAVGLPTDTDAA